MVNGGADGGDGTAPSPIRPASEARRNVEGEPERVTSGDGVNFGYGVGERTLTYLMWLHPFMTYFCWVADRQFPASHRPDTRVDRLRERDPRFYWTCVTLDTVVTVLAVGVLIAAAARGALQDALRVTALPPSGRLPRWSVPTARTPCARTGTTPPASTPANPS